MRVEPAGHLPRTKRLHFVITHAHVPCIVDEAGSLCSRLRLHDLVEDRVHSRRGHVRGISSATAQRRDELGVVFLLDDARVTGEFGKTRTQRVGVNSAVEIGADADEIAHRAASGWPVLEGSLRVEATLGPGDDAEVYGRGGDGGDVVDGVGDVFGVDLGVAEEEAGDVESHGVGEGGGGEEGDEVGGEVDTAGGAGAGGEDYGLFAVAAVGKSGGDVYGASQRCFGYGIGGVIWRLLGVDGHAGWYEVYVVHGIDAAQVSSDDVVCEVSWLEIVEGELDGILNKIGTGRSRPEDARADGDHL
ncbi:hypothetical protein MMC14_006140 [Varicellaria rhodocarpa]|nr:hypothetical protein [Varicellaria rhodocarpa]